MKRVLLVDDEPNLLAALQRLLRSLEIPCECFTASNGDEGLTVARASLPDVIVTDIKMPRMSGLEFLSRLKEDPATARIPVIVLTGHGDSSAKQTALELGAQDFINKPAVPAEFAARIRGLFQLKEYEDQLRDRNEILERQVMQLQKMENMGFVAAGFSHDLRNILGAIVGHIDMASADPGIPERAQSRLKTAAETAMHAAELSRQMLSMSRPAGASATRCDMSALVGESLNLLRVSIRPDIAVVWNNPGPGLCFMGNPMQVHQVLMNLFINAVHAMPDPGALTVRTELVDVQQRLSNGTPPGTYVRLQVSDTGLGMDQATQAHIFEPFFTTKADGKGTGIGLSVVDKIVREHKGAISVESAPGAGTTFSILWPAMPAAELGDAGQGGAVHDASETADTLR
ncbi:MAG: response regulator [Candidatus Zixiibacteriota bacterium]